MRRVNLISDEAFLLLESQQRGRIHSVFSKTCNIIFESGMASLQSEGSVFTPMSLILEGVFSPMRDIPIGTELIYEKNSRLLHCGDLWYDLSNSERCSCLCPVFKAKLPDAAACLNALRMEYEASKPACSDAVTECVYARCHFAMDGVCRATLEQNEEAFVTWTRALVGLGPGLTPSGDDMLTGFCAAARANISLSDFVSKAGSKVLAPARAATTQVSFEFLRFAFKGRFAAPVAGILNAISTGDAALCHSMCQQLLLIGSSSGRDCLYGVMRGVETLCQVKEAFK